MTGAAPDGQDVDPDADRLREECGVFGVFGHPDAAAIVALGLHALQHRGQEAAGIVAFDGERFHSSAGSASSATISPAPTIIDRLPGNLAIGHVRYSTTGETILRNVQPLFAELEAGGLAVAHNGNLTNGLTLRRELIRKARSASRPPTPKWSSCSRPARPKAQDRRPLRRGAAQIEGAYALVALTNKKLIGARDPLGIRPLVLGELDGCPILASETCALDIIGAKFVRDIENGEVVVIRRGRRQELQAVPARAGAALHLRIHLFREARFHRQRPLGLRRPQSDGRGAGPRGPGGRGRRGAGAGFGRAGGARLRAGCGMPFELGIIRNHYVGRTFIQPTQSIRELGVRMKHNPNRAVVAGKRVVLIDNSIVRGTN